MFAIQDKFSFFRVFVLGFCFFFCGISKVYSQEKGATSSLKFGNQSSVTVDLKKFDIENDQSSKGGFSGFLSKQEEKKAEKLSQRMVNFPGTINVLTEKMLRDSTVDRSLIVMMQTLPGIFVFSGENQTFTMRGFKSVGNLSVDGVPAMQRFVGEKIFSPLGLDFAMESVEVLPSSFALTGFAKSGGGMNVIFKRPNFDKKLGSFTVQSSPTAGRYAAYVDIGSPFGKSAYVSTAGRLNVAYMNNLIPGRRPSLRDQTVVIVPSIDFEVGILKAEVTLLARMHRGYLYGGHSIASKDFGDAQLSAESSFENNHNDTPLVASAKYGDYCNENQLNFFAKFLFDIPALVVSSVEHKFDVMGKYGIFRMGRESYGTQVSVNDAADGHSIASKKGIGYKNSNEIYVTSSYGGVGDLESHFIAVQADYKVSVGMIKNEIKMGSSFSLETVGSSGGAQSAQALLPKIKYVDKKPQLEGFEKTFLTQKIGEGTSLYSPVASKTALLFPDEEDLLNKEKNVRAAKATLFGLYGQNQLEILDFLTIVGGAEVNVVYDHARGSKLPKGVWQWGVSPKIGVVGKFLKNKSVVDSLEVYSGFMMGYRPFLGGARYTEYLKSEMKQRSLQGEIGLRTLLKSGFFASFVGYFVEQDVVQHNKKFDTKSQETIANPMFVNIAGVRTVGVELHTKGKVWDGIFVGNSYSFCKKITENTYINPTPTHSQNLWAKYVFQKTPVKGLGVRLAITSQSEISRMDYQGKDKPKALPFQVWGDVGVSYESKNLSLGLLVNNVTNGRIWKSVVDNLRSYIWYDGVDLSMNVSVKF